MLAQRGIPDRVRQVKERQAAERRRVAALIANDQAPQPKKKGKRAQPEGLKPTPEWLARYGETQATARTESGVFLGRPFRRDPWFETLVRMDASDARRNSRPPAFTVDDLHALRRYRNAWEGAQASETRSCLDVGPGGAGGSGSRIPQERARTVLIMSEDLRRMEARVGALVDTLRAVAVEDMSYSQVAMARWGSREVDHYDDATGTFLVKLAPRSGTHPGIIREEFQTAVKWLAGADRANLPAVAPQDAERRDLGHDIAEAVKRAVAAGKSIVGVQMAVWTVRAVGLSLDAPVFECLPVTIREDWQFGWVLVEGGE